MEKTTKYAILMILATIVVLAIRTILITTPLVLFIMFDWKYLLFLIPAFAIDYYMGVILKAVASEYKKFIEKNKK